MTDGTNCSENVMKYWNESNRTGSKIASLRNEKRLKSDIKRAYSKARVEVTLLSKL